MFSAGGAIQPLRGRLVSRLNCISRLIDNDISQRRRTGDRPDERDNPADESPTEKNVYDDYGPRVLLIPADDGREKVKGENHQKEQMHQRTS